MSETTFDNLIVERSDGVATITIDSTSDNNALNERLTEELLSISVTVAEDDSVRCIVLTGRDDIFCSGADIKMLQGDEDDIELIRRATVIAHEAILQLFLAPKPVVTAVNGVAAGGGFGLGILGDVTLVSTRARFEFAYTQLGLTGDAASTYFLPRLVGLQRAKEIVLMNEPIGPNEAVELGLATEVCPHEEFDDRVAEVAAELASGPTVAYGELKHLLTRSFEQSIETQLSDELVSLSKAFSTGDYKRGYESYLAGREPEFEGK